MRKSFIALALCPLLAVVAVLASFELGCGTARNAIGIRGRVIDKPGIAEAVHSVWEVSYLRLDNPPSIRIVEGSELTCISPGGTKGFETPIGCRNGYTATPFEVSVTFDDGVRDFGWDHSTLAHELRHVVHLRKGILDGDHKLPDWRPLTDCQMPPGDCGIVDRANRRLRNEPIELDSPVVQLEPQDAGQDQ